MFVSTLCLNPVGQVHWKLPGVFLHWPRSQSNKFTAHSLISVKNIKINKNDNDRLVKQGIVTGLLKSHFRKKKCKNIIIIKNHLMKMQSSKEIISGYSTL